MQAENAIVVQNVSKIFKLFGSPKERVMEAFHPYRKCYHQEFWALRDVSFEVRRGEVLGILGRNGSGKSTLLQIICAIMQATQGKVWVNGKISALLELGAGFNPEFTGRENAILNGAIMGFPRKEMLRRLPNIEAFADIGGFFDQPVKIYSSGMFVRLAFACSINLDSDILVVDEALAVGDASFQNKCYMQIKKFQAEGKTIILVSHSTEAILRQCTTALLMEHGKMILHGGPQSVVDRYYQVLFPSASQNNVFKSSKRISRTQYDVIDLNRAQLTALHRDSLMNLIGTCETRNTYNKNEIRFGNREVEVVDYALFCDNRLYPIEIISGAKISLYVRLLVNSFDGLLSVGFALRAVDGVKLFGANTLSNGVKLPSGSMEKSFWVRFEFFMNVGAGDVFIDLGCGDWTSPSGHPLDRRQSIIHLVVKPNGRFEGLCNCFVDISVINEWVVGAPTSSFT